MYVEYLRVPTRGGIPKAPHGFNSVPVPRLLYRIFGE